MQALLVHLYRFSLYAVVNKVVNSICVKILTFIDFGYL